jgi:hypothetical protein
MRNFDQKRVFKKHLNLKVGTHLHQYLLGCFKLVLIFLPRQKKSTCHLDKDTPTNKKSHLVESHLIEEQLTQNFRKLTQKIPHSSENFMQICREFPKLFSYRAM